MPKLLSFFSVDLIIFYILRCLRRLGPLWAMGVISLTDRMSSAWAPKVLTAESLPWPTPDTYISTLRGPVLLIFSIILAITFEAAKGVAFLGPEKPVPPALAQVTTSPLSSVTGIKVLLYEALI